MFTTAYPGTPSSIFDLHKSLMEDEEAFYHSILARYGKLVWKENVKPEKEGLIDDDEGGTFIDYNNNGEIKMLVVDDHINLDSSENRV